MNRRRKQFPYICIQCGIIFYDRRRSDRIPKFCSHNCHSLFQKGKKVLSDEQSKQLGILKRKRIQCTCEICGCLFEKRPSEIKAGRGITCSKKCLGRKNGNRNIGKWPGGRYHGIPSSPNFHILYSKQFLVTRRLAKKRDKVCKICNKAIKLIAHHVIPEQLTHDDNLDNLVSLCYSCHTKVDHLSLCQTVLNEYNGTENLSQDGETVPSYVDGNAALKVREILAERPTTDHSLNIETQCMARMAIDRIRSINGRLTILGEKA